MDRAQRIFSRRRWLYQAIVERRIGVSQDEIGSAVDALYEL